MHRRGKRLSSRPVGGVGSDPAMVPVGRTVLGRASPCVGRDRELDRLEAIWRSCVDERVARAALVVSPPGVGKTRLASELLPRISADARVLVAHGGNGSPLGATRSLLRDAIRHELSSCERAAREGERARLDAYAERIALDPGSTQLLAHLLGVVIDAPVPRVVAARNDPRVLREAMRSAVRAWIAAECAVRPLVVVLDDAHACDGATLGYLGEALAWCHARPLFVCALARPISRPSVPPEWPIERVHEIVLPPLGPDASRALARAVLGDDAPACELGRVVDRAGGNAIHLEELLRHVATGVDAPLSADVTAVVDARLRALPVAARRVLEAAAVFGERFSREGLRHIVGGEGGGDVDALVEALLDAEVVLETNARGPFGERELRIRHELLRDAAYASASAEERERAHRKAAEWLERVEDRDPLVIAEHHERGGDPQRALPFRVRAAEDAIAGGDLVVAREQSRRGLRVASDPESRARLLAVKASVAEAEGRWNDLRTIVREAMPLVEPGSARWFLGASTLGYAGMVLQDPSTIVELIQAILPLEGPLPASGPTGFAFQNIIVTGFHAGQRELMKLFVARLDVTSTAARGHDRDPAFEAWCALAHAYDAVVDDDLGRALAESERAVLRAAESGDTMALRTTHGMLGYFRADAGDLDGAEAAVADVAPRGDDVASLLAEYVRMRAALERGELDRVTRLAGEPSRTILPATRARLVLADALLRRGDVEQSARIAGKIADASETLPSLLATALPVLSRARLAGGDPQGALEAAVRAYAIAARTGYVRDRSDAVLARVEALEATGRVDEARTALESAAARIERIASGLPAARRARFLALQVHARTLERAQRVG